MVCSVDITLERVQRLVKPIIVDLYKKTLINSDFSDPEDRLGYLDNDEQIKEELIKKYSLSYQDINACRKFDVNTLIEENNFDEIKTLHIALCNYYKSLRDDDTVDCTV